MKHTSVLHIKESAMKVLAVATDELYKQVDELVHEFEQKLINDASIPAEKVDAMILQARKNTTFYIMKNVENFIAQGKY